MNLIPVHRHFIISGDEVQAEGRSNHAPDNLHDTRLVLADEAHRSQEINLYLGIFDDVAQATPPKALHSSAATLRRPIRSIQLTPARIGPVPDLRPKLQRGREVAVRQGGDRERDEGFGRPVKGAGAAGMGAGRRPFAATERDAGLLPVAGRRPFYRQHLDEIGPAAVAGRPAGMPGPAGRAVFHVGYSR